MDILNRININHHVKSKDINKIIEKSNNLLANIKVEETEIVENSIDAVKSKYNKFIEDVSIILNKNTSQTFVYANIFPTTTYTKVNTNSTEYSYSYEKINDILSVTETMVDFPCFNSSIFTHDTSEYKIISEGDSEHFVDITFPTAINENQYYVVQLNDGTHIATKKNTLRVYSVLYSNYALPRYTITTNDKTKFVSQPYALLSKNMNDSKKLVFKTPNIETKDIHIIKIKDIFVGILSQNYPLRTQVSIDKNIPINSKFSISEVSVFENINIYYNDVMIDINEEITNTGKPITFEFLSNDSYIDKIVVKAI